MEILSSSISSKFRSSSPLSSTTLFTSLITKNPYKFRTTHLKPFTNPPFLTNLPLKIRCYPLVFSRFDRPRKRRNSLRKKLKGNGGPQVRKNPQKIIDPVHQFVDNQSSDSIISSNDRGLEKGSFEMSEKSFNLENSGKIGENVLWDKLEGWVEQYKKDIDFWGIGSYPIFTVFQDSSGNVERVLVDEDEIVRRSGFEPFRFREERVLEEINEVDSKVSYAKSLAKELECGKKVIPRNSSVTKFVVSGEKLGLVGSIRSVFVPRKSLANVSRVGIAVVCGFVLVWMVRKVFSMGLKEVELTSLEKEMLRRKMKSRMVKEKLQIGNVEVVEEPVERPIVVTERPRIDKKEVLNMIREANGSSESLVVVDVGGSRESGPTNMDSKIKEIQMMARNARKIEKGEESPSEINGLDELEREASIVLPSVGKDDAQKLVDNVNRLNVSKIKTLGNLDEVSECNGDLGPLSDSSGRIIDDVQSHINGVTQSHDMSNSEINSPKKTPQKRKPKIMRSVKEAREYLSKKLEVCDVSTSCDISRMGENDREPESFEEDSQFYNIEQNELLLSDTTELGIKTESELNQNSPQKSNEIFKLNDLHERSDFFAGENDSFDAREEENQPLLTKQNVEKVDKLDETLKSTVLSEISDLDSGKNTFASNSIDKVKVNGINGGNVDGSDFEDKVVLPTDINDEDNYCRNEVENEFSTSKTIVDHGNGVDEKERGLIVDKEKWLEKNFHEVEPIVKKIGSGFRNSYNVAREKIKEDVDTKFDLMKLSSINYETELEWMEDDKLREIVFKVRDNELAGRDPFDSMDPHDKIAFFEGLERKVEKENEKLSTLHEWLQSNIENFDYGADGISIYDPPEKVIPRWKGPPLDTFPEFLNSTKNQQKESSLEKANESTKHESIETSPTISSSKSPHKGKNPKVSRTIIEASDGSIKPGKKSGKEFWQHTKKWSRGFLESYNAETDPEVKSVMKDIGKDLDRWITEKEIKEARELMDKLPQHKKVIENKLKKLKREMELFGPQAVVSKYREYAEEKEEDYLWWLDLPHLLCIELYTYEDEDQRVGFYSLEMAEDLELEPKPRHVIAFQDPGDCKNFCYIIQAHLEMIGKGKAFIVPQPPKDVYRQAKGDGFGVTVIRKGELKMNVDQPLEEVEELIIEIGSKMYHDKIMGERSLDISSLMKGVFGSSLPSTRRKQKKRARKRPR